MYPLLKFIAEFFDGRGKSFRVVVEGHLVDEQGVEARDRGRVGGPQPGQALQGPALAVDDLDAAPQPPGGDLDPAEFFNRRKKTPVFTGEQLPAEGAFLLGQVHDIEVVDQPAQDFVGFFLAVAGVFADHHVGRLKIGTDPAQLETEGRFDQGAGGARQCALNQFQAEVGPGAEPDQDGVGGQHDLFRHKNAKGSDHLAAGLFRLQQFLYPEAVDLAHDKIKIGGLARPVGLAGENFPVARPQAVEQHGMGFKVESQIPPHLLVFSLHI